MARHADIVIVGGGVMGLWTAVTALRAGYSVRLLEQAVIGAGASGGVVGALAPHMPDRWNAKKQFQLEALTELGPALETLEAETGLPTGFRRSGRLQPILPGHVRFLEERLAGAKRHWAGQAAMEVRAADQVPYLAPPETGQWMHDTLTACLNPRQTCAALAARVRALGGVIDEGVRVTKIAPQTVRTRTADYAADRIVLAAGVAAFDLLEPLIGTQTGRGEKGQAALLWGATPDGMPMIYSDGLYIIPHRDGSVAIGSTSERSFTAPTSTDAHLDALVERARAVAPFLQDAQVIDRWAGVRPRGNGRDPMIGPVPGAPGVFAMMAGFKISFGIAEKAARLLVAGFESGELDVPETFSVTHHIAASG